MLKMMAADNDDAYSVTPSFIIETIRAAKSFIYNKIQPAGADRKKVCYKDESPILHDIHKFLDWPRHRVQVALAQRPGAGCRGEHGEGAPRRR